MKNKILNIFLLTFMILFILNFQKDSNNLFIFSWDYATMFVPWKNFLISSIQDFNSIPLWNPYNFCGEPFWTNLQTTVLYPFNILFFLLSLEWAFEVQSQIHYIILGIFYFLFFCRFFKNKIAVWLSTITILLSHFFLFNINNITVLYAITYLPVQLYALIKIIKTQNNKYYIFFFISSLLLFLSGHQQYIFYNLLFLSALFLFYLFHSKINKTIIIKLVITVILLLIFISFQYYPTIKSLHLFSRSGADFSTFGQLHPIHLITVLIPDFFGNSADNSFIGFYYKPLYNNINIYEFLGLIPLIIIISACFKKFFIKDYKFYILLAGIILPVLISLGNYTPVMPALTFLFPPFKWFRLPNRILYIYVINSSFLTGYIIDRYLNTPNINLNIRFKQITLLMIIGTLIILGFLVFNQETVLNFLKDNFIRNELNIEKNIFIVNQYNRIIKNIIFFQTKLMIIYFILIIIKNKIKLFTLFFLFLLIELLTFNARFLNYVNSFNFPESKKIINYITNDTGYYRVLSLLHTDSTFDKNKNLHIKKHSVKGDNPMVLNNFVTFFNKIETDRNKVHPNTVVGIPDINLPVLDTLSIKYIITNNNIDNSKFISILYDSNYQQHLYLNPDYKPLFYTMNNVSNDSKIIFTNNYDSSNTIYIKNFNKKFVSVNNNDKDIIEIKYYSPNKILININKHSPGILVFADTYHPNWQCRVNENKVKIYEVNKLLKGIFLESGNYKVEFNFKIL